MGMHTNFRYSRVLGKMKFTASVGLLLPTDRMRRPYTLLYGVLGLQQTEMN